MRLKVLALCLCASVVSAQAAHVYFDLDDFRTSGQTMTGRVVRVQLLTAPSVSGNSVITGDRYTTNSGVTGSFIISNMLAGNYRADVVGPQLTTMFEFTVPTNNVLLDVVGLLTINTNNLAEAANAYTVAAAEALFVRKLNGWSSNQFLTNPVVRGLRLPDYGAVASYVWTCTNAITGEGHWAPGGGGGGGEDRIAMAAGRGTNTTFAGQTNIGTVRLENTSGTNALTVNTNQLVVTNGNVGIGTANPTAKLHVNGGAVLGGTLTLGSGATFTETTIGFVDGGSITDIGAGVPGGVRLGALQLTTGAGAGRIGVSDASGNHGWGPHTNSFVRTNALLNSKTILVDGSHPLATATGPIYNHPTNLLGSSIPAGSHVLIAGRYTNTLLTNLTVVRASLNWTNLTNVTIEGVGGATILGTNYGNHIYITGCDRLTLKNLTIEGGKPLTTTHPADDLCGAVVHWGTNQNLVFEMVGLLNIMQHGFLDFGGDSICYDTNTVYRDCWAYNLGTTNHVSLGKDGAVIANFGAGAKITGLRARHVARGIECQGTAGIGRRIDHWLIDDNQIEGVFGDFGIFTAPPVSNIQASNMSQGVISRNLISGLEGNYNFYGIAIRFGEQIGVYDNIIRNTYEGIEARSTLYSISKIGIRGNIITDIRANGFGRGIHLIDDGPGVLSDVLVNENFIFRIFNGGIVFEGGSHITLDGNWIVDAGREAAESPIHFYGGDGAKTNNVIRKNRIWAEGPVTSTVGITVLPGYVGTILEDNDVRGYATPVSLAGTVGRAAEYVNRDQHMGVLSVSNVVQAGSVQATNGITDLSLTASRPMLSDGGKKHVSGQIDLANGNHVTGVLADGSIPASITRDSEWDTTTEINTATTDDDFVTLLGAQTIGGVKTFSTNVNFTEVPSVPTPAANQVSLYAKDDGGVSKLFYKGDNGTEVGPLGTGGSGTPGGSSGHVQYNNSSSFDGAAGVQVPTGQGETNLTVAGKTSTYDLQVTNTLTATTINATTLNTETVNATNVMFTHKVLSSTEPLQWVDCSKHSYFYTTNIATNIVVGLSNVTLGGEQHFFIHGATNGGANYTINFTNNGGATLRVALNSITNGATFATVTNNQTYGAGIHWWQNTVQTNGEFYHAFLR